MSFNWEISISGLIALVGLIIAIGRVLLQQRDAMRDLIRQIGTAGDSKFDRSGVLGQLANQHDEIDRLRQALADHSDWHAGSVERRHRERRTGGSPPPVDR